MDELILVKLGGSLITDKRKPFTTRPEVIARLAAEIHSARSSKKFKLVVAHGGGSFPHQPAARYQTQKGVLSNESYRGIAEVQDAASQLNRIVVNALLKAGENAVSVQPSACSLANNGRLVDWYLPPIKKMLEFDLLPVPYGDVVLDLKKGCCIASTEEILYFLAKKLRANKVIVAGEVDGVLNGERKLISEITAKSLPKVKKFLKGSSGVDVTGGMLHKIERMTELANACMESIVINGLAPGRLQNALLGKKVLGTEIRK